MKKTVLLTSATILLGVGFQAINASAAETFPKEYNTEGTTQLILQGQERVVLYQLIMGQNLNLAHKRFLRQIKRIMLRQMK